jgi:hypothetical protein
MQVLRPRLFRVKFDFGPAGLCVLSLLLMVCLVFPVGTAAGQRSSPGETAIIFYANPQVTEQLWKPLFDAFRAEVARERQDYPLPEDFEPLRATSFAVGREFGEIIEVRLIGRCDVAEQAWRPLPPGPLGWVVRASGEIQPFIYVDCGRLAQYLGPAMLGLNENQRMSAMARAISRIAIHEWIHIDSQSGRHQSRGIRQAELSGRNLVDSGGSPGGR